MGKTDKSYLVAGGYLNRGDYMVSNNGLFHVILQYDGNLCVYRGSGPEQQYGGALFWSNSHTTNESVIAAYFHYDAASKRVHTFGVCYGTDANHMRHRLIPELGVDIVEHRWSAGNLGTDNFYAIIQDDGNFCIYEGNAPHENPRGLWCANSVDAIVKFEVSSFDYDVDHATIDDTTSREIIRQRVPNHTGVEQTQTVSRTETIEETWAWENKMGFKVGAEAMVKAGIPFIAGGKVKVSVEVSGEFAWSGSTKKGKEYKFDTPVVVPPRTTVIAIATVTVSKISVPYTENGEYVHKSGTRVPGKRTGTYTGVTSYNFETEFREEAANGALVPISAEKLHARPTVSTIWN